MTVTTTTCDCGCGASTDSPAEQGWWLVGDTRLAFDVRPWNDAKQGWQHAAGSECVHKLLSQWMDSRREG